MNRDYGILSRDANGFQTWSSTRPQDVLTFYITYRAWVERRAKLDSSVDVERKWFLTTDSGEELPMPSIEEAKELRSTNIPTEHSILMGALAS